MSELTAMSIKQLREVAKTRGVSLDGCLEKTDIVQTIAAAQVVNGAQGGGDDGVLQQVGPAPAAAEQNGPVIGGEQVGVSLLSPNPSVEAETVLLETVQQHNADQGEDAAHAPEPPVNG